MTLHPIVADAAAGRFPAWTEASASRREHVGRVADLMGQWAERAGLSETDQARWRAAGLLHDTLHDADPDTLRPRVDEEVRGAPDKILHGPAAAVRLREEGVEDGPLLQAIAWHTLGDPAFQPLGRALYMADYCEPGREYESPRLAAWRDRVPDELDAVLRDVAAERIGRQLTKGRPLLPRTVAFWNALLEG